MIDSDDRLSIETPEQVVLELPVAGIGSRFLALGVDSVLQSVLYITATLTLMYGVPAIARASLPLLAQLGAASAILIGFCIYWGYFAFFEILWSGRTPGKRLAGIRVIKESGRPINAYEAIGRNIMRAIDFLPALYGLGVVVMMANRNSRRLGDYLAGTVVIHDKKSGGAVPDWHKPAGGTLATPPLANVSVDELVLIEAYLQRRSDLEPLVRDEMAERIAKRIVEKTGRARDPQRPVDEFLESVARQVRDTPKFR
jgi:uncharacterized RDD family membrane protein YckC